tara:strand:+ start:49 stop:408 length:360 start_codon:yes stop_codon:yes gene_type:complete
MEWKDILKQEDLFMDGLTFDEYVNRMISESRKREAEKTPLQKLYYVIDGYLDARPADELRELLEDERFKGLNENDKRDIEIAISDMESAIYEVDHTIQGLLEKEQTRLKDEKAKKETKS